MEKLSKLNDDIRSIVERQNRMIQRRAQEQASGVPKVQKEMITVQMTQSERQAIRDSVKLKMYESQKDVTGKEKKTDMILQRSEQA